MAGGRTAVLAVALAVLAAAGTSAALLLPAEQAAPAPAPAALPEVDPVAAPERPPLLPPLDAAAPLPGRAGVDAAVTAALADPAVAGQLAASVVDVTTGEVLLDLRATTPTLPASTAKIVTATAALLTLPHGLRLETRVLAGPTSGSVVLLGGGDTTLGGAGVPLGGAEGRLADLARQVREAVGGTPVTEVLVDDRLYTGDSLGPAWRPTYVSDGDVAPVSALSVDSGRVEPAASAPEADPALAAGTDLAGLLGAPPAAVRRGQAPTGARELAIVRSDPLPELLQGALLRSDNDLTESLLRQVALAGGEPPTFTGGAAAVRAALADAGLDAGGLALVDGSGLSRENRVAPAALTALLRRVATDDALAPVLAGLPVAGFEGTLARRYDQLPQATAAGVVRGKTGTLEGVSALGGLLRTDDGRLLAFDLVADAVPVGATRQAEAALDRLAAALAACGCP